MRFRFALLGLACMTLISGCGGGSATLGFESSPPGGLGGTGERGTLVSFTKQADWSQSLLNFALHYGGTYAIDATTGATLYSITYNTIDVNGNPTVASGAVAVPDGATSCALVSYQHSTATAKNQVPSSSGYSEGIFAMAAFAGSGKYVVCMADYLGLGSNPGLHPFFHAQSEATAAMDMILAARAFLKQLTGAPTLNGKLFLTGYSQGGHATMSLSKTLQASGWTVTASGPCAGPYDLSGVTTTFSLNSPGPDTPVFLAYLAVAYNSVYKNVYTTPSDIFQSPYDVNVPPLFGANNGIDDIKSWCPATAQLMFKSDFIAQLTNTSSVVSQDMQANNLYNWKPTMPMTLFHAQSDDIVPFQNSVKAVTTMQENGASQVHLVNLGTGLTHAEAFVPAMVHVRQWFDTM